jgi:enterochelin esterase family protein
MRTLRQFSFFLIALFALNLSVHAQSMTELIDEVNGFPDPVDQQNAVDAFLSGISQYPWIDGDTAHFLYQDGGALQVVVAGDFNGWDASATALFQLASTDLWYRSIVFEDNARLDYKIVVDGSWILDPNNPNTVSGGFGPNSELAMPAYVQPWEIEDLGNPAGIIETDNITSTYTGKTYSVQIYLPPGYDAAEKYPSAYFHDGHEYVDLASANFVMDNLIDEGSIEELIGVFVRPTNRSEEYAFSQRFDYADFFVMELIPWIESKYSVHTYADSRAIIGPSFGGNISGLICERHPEAFGNLGLHSAAFWPNFYEVYNSWLSNAPEGIQVASIWGSYEGSLSTNNWDFINNVMIPGGYDYIDDELPEGHSWGLWRATLDDMLKFFFPPGSVGLDSENSFELNQSVFPNPAREEFFLEFELEAASEISMEIIGLYGRQLWALPEMSYAQGLHRVFLNRSDIDAGAGIYFWVISSKYQSTSSKLMLD